MIARLIIWLSDLAYEQPWTSWLMHGLLALPICWAFGPLAAAVFYLLRELEQIAHAYAQGARQDWVDHFLDVWSPWAVAAAWSILA